MLNAGSQRSSAFFSTKKTSSLFAHEDLNGEDDVEICQSGSAACLFNVTPDVPEDGWQLTYL